jgi:hypothetical protein
MVTLRELMMILELHRQGLKLSAIAGARQRRRVHGRAPMRNMGNRDVRYDRGEMRVDDSELGERIADLPPGRQRNPQGRAVTVRTASAGKASNHSGSCDHYRGLVGDRGGRRPRDSNARRMMGSWFGVEPHIG